MDTNRRIGDGTLFGQSVFESMVELDTRNHPHNTLMVPWQYWLDINKPKSTSGQPEVLPVG